MNDEEGHEVFIISANGQVVRINLAEVKVVNTRQTKGVIIWRERGGDDSVVSIYCFRANDYSQEDPSRQNEDAGSALAQAEEVAAQADSQYEDGDELEVDEADLPNDDGDDEGDDDGGDEPDTPVNGQGHLL